MKAEKKATTTFTYDLTGLDEEEARLLYRAVNRASAGTPVPVRRTTPFSGHDRNRLKEIASNLENMLGLDEEDEEED